MEVGVEGGEQVHRVRPAGEGQGGAGDLQQRLRRGAVHDDADRRAVQGPDGRQDPQQVQGETTKKYWALQLSSMECFSGEAVERAEVRRVRRAGGAALRPRRREGGRARHHRHQGRQQVIIS